jgi:hypothetical protein
MITIQWTKNGTEGSREFRTQVLADRFAAGLARTGYTVLDSAPAVEVPAAPVAITGRVGKGTAVHQIVEGHAKCGASYRKGHSFGTTRKVAITGEEVTCRGC